MAFVPGVRVGLNDVSVQLGSVSGRRVMKAVGAGRRRCVVASAMELSDVGRSLTMTSVVFFLTSWGMVSFVKGSTKARIIQASYTVGGQSPKDLVENAVRHFTSRAYAIDPEEDKRPGVITFKVWTLHFFAPSCTPTQIIYHIRRTTIFERCNVFVSFGRDW